jgi:hypothetical protein
MATPARKLDQFQSIHALAVHSLECASGNWDKACEIMEQILFNDDEVYTKFGTPLLKSAIRHEIVDCVSSSRDQFWAPPQPDRAKKDGGLLRVAASNLLNFPLAGGLRLGDATKAQLEENANLSLKRARTYALHGRWYELIAKGLKRKETVAEVFDHDQLKRLQEKAEKES